MKDSGPRPLGILRVEDEADVASPSVLLPLSDLGRIGRWASFVRGLARGEVLVERSGQEEVALNQIPEILGIDFRFIFDDSTPAFKHSDDPSTIGWSDKLNAKSTGIVIGATLEGIFKASDLPLMVVLHTLTPADVGQDVATILMVGQLLAGSGTLPESDAKHPFDQARDVLFCLPKNCEDGVKMQMQGFRDSLLRRLGVLQSSEPPRLMVDPDALVLLLSELDAAESEEDLDQRLSRVGLAVWDRQKRLHTIDLRSLFMDFLGEARSGYRWGLLPFESAKVLVENNQKCVGEVVSFLTRIQDTVGKDYLAAADHIVANLDQSGKPVPFRRGDRAGKKLLALVFSCAEVWASLGVELARRLDRPWSRTED